MSEDTVQTFPSQAVTVLDVPNPGNFAGKFLYNKYNFEEGKDTTPQSVWNQGYAPTWETAGFSGKTVSPGIASAKEIKFRFDNAVSLTWTPAPNSDITIPDSEIDLALMLRTAYDYGQINDEAHLGTPGFFGIAIDDPSRDMANKKLILFQLITQGAMQNLPENYNGDLNSLPAEWVLNHLSMPIGDEPHVDTLFRSYVSELFGNPDLNYSQVDYYKHMVGSEPSTVEESRQAVGGSAPSLMNLQINNALGPHLFSRGMSFPTRFQATWADAYEGAAHAYQEAKIGFQGKEEKLKMVGLKSSIEPWTGAVAGETFDPIEFTDLNQAFAMIENSSPTLVGYMVVGHEIQSELSPNSSSISTNKRRVIFTSPTRTQLHDVLVTYGRKYMYQVHSIANVSLLVLQDGKYKKIQALVKSNPSNSIIINCVDTKYTPPPVDITFRWDYGYIRKKDQKRGRLVIEWNHPVSPENDVKYHQVYRRSSVAHPYELLREYDFNDKMPFDEQDSFRPDTEVIKGNFSGEGATGLHMFSVPNLREKRQDPNSDLIKFYPEDDYKIRPVMKTRYADYEFTKESVSIYTMASVDAHGNFSNYATQYGVWFDNTTNEIVVDLVSPSGAPLPHPNWFLNPSLIMSRRSGHYLMGMTWGEDGRYPVPDWAQTLDAASRGSSLSNITVDCIKSSRYNKFNVYFDPDVMNTYENLEDGGYSGMSTIAYKESHEGIKSLPAVSVGSYQMQMINVDRGRSQIVDIFIDEKRDTVTAQQGADKEGELVEGAPYWQKEGPFVNWPGK